MILWVADRFGMPGHFHRIWLRLLLTTGHQPPEFRIHKLSDALKRTLLTKLGSRKAPTWIPDEAPHIIAQIERWCDQYKPRAVVLSSPESLAYLAMAPEHATLHNLRGSVYWRRGIPFIVSLPISAWVSLVSQKDVGAANYGFDSAEAFGAARSEDGEVYEDSDQRISRELARSTSDAQGGDVHSGRTEGQDSNAQGRRDDELGDRRDKAGDSNPARSPSGVGRVYGRTLPPAGTRIDIRSPDDEVERAESAIAAEQLDQADLSSDDDDGEDLELDGSSDDSVDSSGDERDPGDSGGDLSPVTDGEDDVDRFFYEPVLSPVGRFALTADMMKLARVLEFGRRSDGPEKPIVLRY